MKIIKAIGKFLLAVLLLVVIFILGLFIYHRICISSEKELISTPVGELVEVDGHNMCVYSEGEGDKTIVFMSGFGTPSPVMDFRSLFRLLSDEYRIAVVEKFGYGFSDDYDCDRSVDVMLENTRAALKGAGIDAPYVLCPHSFSGTEALYWAQKYPGEIDGIAFLDAVVPGLYDICPVDNRYEYVTKFAADIGAMRLIPDNELIPAIGNGTLTPEEKKICAALNHSRFRTKAMINEVLCAPDSLAAVTAGGVPDVPMLFFISDMGLTDEKVLEEYRQLAYKYTLGKAEYVYLDCPHNVHDFEYVRIAEDIKKFLAKNNKS